MNPKYVVSYRLPSYVLTALWGAYQRSVGRDLPVSTPHISLSFSFYLHEGYGEEWLIHTVQSVSFPEIGGWLSMVSYFTQNSKKILYIGVEPKHDFVALHRKISRELQQGIHHDLTVFDGGVLPTYLPHVTLDYDFDGDAYTLSALHNEKIEAYFDVTKLSIMRITSTRIDYL